MDNNSRGGNKMSRKCPICNREMIRKKVQIYKGIWAEAEVCQNCKEEWFDEKEFDRIGALFQRKVFTAGGSLAVRIPKEIAQKLKMKSGTIVNLKLGKNKIIIEPNP